VCAPHHASGCELGPYCGGRGQERHGQHRTGEATVTETSFRDRDVLIEPKKRIEDRVEQAMRLNALVENVDWWVPVGAEKIIKHWEQGVLGHLKDTVTPLAKDRNEAHAPTYTKSEQDAG
jgi:hypothetical protein